MATVTYEEMRDKLMSLDELRARVAPTEHLSEFEFSTSANDAVFNYPEGWQDAISKEADGLTPTDVTITLQNQGVTRPLTKDAALEAASLVGLQKSYTLATPGPMISDHVNYWYSHGDKNLKLLAGPQRGVAFTRASITPFSNNEILGAVLEGVAVKYGLSAIDDVAVDYKFNHDLRSTNMRLIVPTVSRLIDSARHTAEVPDTWSIGVDIRNSVTGVTPLELSGYLFSWWCTNGCTTKHVSSGKYRRKPTASPEDAYDWARTVVDEVLGGLEDELDSVQALTQIPLEGELNETLGRMFNQFGVPTNLRELVIGNLVESDDLTAYGLMQAITSAANGDGLSEAAVSSLLHAGGQVAHVLADRCETCHRFG